MTVTKTITLTAVGDDHDVIRNVPGLSAGLFVTDAWFMVKGHAGDTDAAALISKHVTTTPAIGVGQVTDTGAVSTLASFIFQLLGADTVKLAADFAYIYAIKVKLNTAREFTLETGTLSGGPQVITTT